MLLYLIHHLQMSSAAGKVPSPGQALYSASKHALNGYFSSLRSEVEYYAVLIKPEQSYIVIACKLYEYELITCVNQVLWLIISPFCQNSSVIFL
jgi:hypothetical protein